MKIHRIKLDFYAQNHTDDTINDISFLILFKISTSLEISTPSGSSETQILSTTMKDILSFFGKFSKIQSHSNPTTRMKILFFIIFAIFYNYYLFN